MALAVGSWLSEGYLILRELVLARSHASLPQLPLGARPRNQHTEVRHTARPTGTGRAGPGGAGEGLAAQRPGCAPSRRSERDGQALLEARVWRARHRHQQLFTEVRRKDLPRLFSRAV